MPKGTLSDRARSYPDVPGSPVAGLMCDHCPMEKQVDDLDSAQFRSARFGRLPARVRPDTTVEMVETAPPQGRPEAAGSEEQRLVFLAGG